LLTEREIPKKQILVVEDEGLIGADLQRRLERLGYSAPAVAHSGEEALEYAHATAFDLVLMDIRLKGSLDGISTAERLKSELQLPVVYITAHADQETLERAKLTEPFGYVIKPIADAGLRSAVQIAIYKSGMERRLRTSEAWLAATLGSVGDGIVACDTSGEIAFLNPVAEQLTGWTTASAKGKPLLEVLHLFEDGTNQPARNPVFDLFPGENRVYTLVSKTGSAYPVEIGSVENRAADELLGSILAIRNAGPRRELERRLVQSQRMEAASATAGGLAHDFNNLLMIILSGAEELASRLSGPEQSIAADIKQAASVAGSIVNQLLLLSRRETPPAEVLNLNEIVTEIEPLLSHSLGKNRSFFTDLGAPEAFLWGNRGHLKQVLLNLTLNARDAMSPGSELRISTEPVEIDEYSPDVRRYRAGRYVRLRVADTGHGMDEATLARIFEPFFTTKAAGATTKPNGAGTGLGLSIVHSIVTQSGGYISAASGVGRGTTFEILLPSIGSLQPACEAACPGTVLLVEDEKQIRRLAHTHLDRAGFQVLEASNAANAEAMAAAWRGPIDVLVTDVVMEDSGSGPEIARRLAPRHPAMKILFISGYRHGAIDEFPGLSAELLSKPFPPSELVRRVQKLLGISAPQAA
jgi:two-component system, cell cycle sensor histidine kinase and response regulator CckA